MNTLWDVIIKAKQEKKAVGHFNISNLEGLWGIFNAARTLNVPVIIGTSEGERDFIGVRQAVALVKSLREEFGYPIFLNADHTYSFERVKEAVDAGYDAVIFDGAKLSLEENIAETRRCVEYAKSVNPNIIVEGELGFIGTSSKLLDGIPEGVELGEESLTHVADAVRFVEETGVDMLAPAVGNMHGMLKGGVDPRLNIKRIKELAEAVSVPLVLHGASGNVADDIADALAAGISLVHINTEIRVAYRDGLRKSLQEDPEEVAPYKFLKGGVQAVQKVVESKLKIFNRI